MSFDKPLMYSWTPDGELLLADAPQGKMYCETLYAQRGSTIGLLISASSGASRSQISLRILWANVADLLADEHLDAPDGAESDPEPPTFRSKDCGSFSLEPDVPIALRIHVLAPFFRIGCYGTATPAEGSRVTLQVHGSSPLRDMHVLVPQPERVRMQLVRNAGDRLGYQAVRVGEHYAPSEVVEVKRVINGQPVPDPVLYDRPLETTRENGIRPASDPFGDAPPEVQPDVALEFAEYLPDDIAPILNLLSQIFSNKGMARSVHTGIPNVPGQGTMWLGYWLSNIDPAQADAALQKFNPPDALFQGVALWLNQKALQELAQQAFATVPKRYSMAAPFILVLFGIVNILVDLDSIDVQLSGKENTVTTRIHGRVGPQDPLLNRFTINFKDTIAIASGKDPNRDVASWPFAVSEAKSVSLDFVNVFSPRDIILAAAFQASALSIPEIQKASGVAKQLRDRIPPLGTQALVFADTADVQDAIQDRQGGLVFVGSPVQLPEVPPSVEIVGATYVNITSSFPEECSILYVPYMSNVKNLVNLKYFWSLSFPPGERQDVILKDPSVKDPTAQQFVWIRFQDPLFVPDFFTLTLVVNGQSPFNPNHSYQITAILRIVLDHNNDVTAGPPQALCRSPYPVDIPLTYSEEQVT